MEGTQLGTLNNGSDARSLLGQKLQITAVCPGGQPSSSQCPVIGGDIGYWTWRYMLPNGAAVSTPQDVPSADMIVFTIDANGAASPNTARDSSSAGNEPFDQIQFTVCVRQGGVCDGRLGIPVPGFSWQNRSSFEEVFR